MSYCDIVLHGGYRGLWEGAGSDLPFFEKIAKAARNTDNKLMISFLAHETPSAFPHLDELIKAFHNLCPSLEISIADRANFRSLLKDHKVLFLQGGGTTRQYEALSSISKEELIYNKTLVAGSSSGAMSLCTYGFSSSVGSVVKGKEIIDICLIPHANTRPIKDYLPQLHAVSDKPVLLLDEYAMVDFSIKNT